jgi:hypothetical protein
MKQIDSIAPLLLACRRGMAKEQSSSHLSRLALWPCTAASDDLELQMIRQAPPSAQSRWSASTQKGFTAWLAAGGFAQEEVQEAQELKRHGEQLASHWGDEVAQLAKQHETA